MEVKSGIFTVLVNMKYSKFDKSMQKSGIDYNLQEKDTLIQIETAPESNDIAVENIQSAMKRYEILVNSQPGKFSVIQKDIKVYKVSKDEELES
jgi:hypothetical protein